MWVLLLRKYRILPHSYIQKYQDSAVKAPFEFKQRNDSNGQYYYMRGSRVRGEGAVVNGLGMPEVRTSPSPRENSYLLNSHCKITENWHRTSPVNKIIPPTP